MSQIPHLNTQNDPLNPTAIAPEPDSAEQSLAHIENLLIGLKADVDHQNAPSESSTRSRVAAATIRQKCNLWQQRWRYRFDSFMARGGSSIFISLVIVFVVGLLAISAVRGCMLLALPEASLERGTGFLHNVYVTFLQMTDPGNMNQDVDSAPIFKIAAILAGLLGVVMLSTLVAFITTSLDQKISQLKKGHSKVIEANHTLILGWNERVLEILRELVLANESEDNPVVVILADEDKEVMDDHLRLNIPDTGNTRVVTRSGSPSSLVNLDVASFASCRSVIVLAHGAANAPSRQREASDAMVIKTVLALAAARDDKSELNVVAEICTDGNRSLVEDISPGDITTVDIDDILAKILVQTSRSVGLSVVYSEVLSFDGCEMYFHQADWGTTKFGQLAYRFPDGVPMGLRHADGTISINPSADLDVQPDDTVLILAEDDSTIDYRAHAVATPRSFPALQRRKEQSTEHNLIIGWTPRVETVLREYAGYVLDGSTVTVMLRQPCDSVVEKVASLNDELTNMQIQLIEGNPLTKDGLIAVKPARYDNIIIVSQGQAGADDETTESETIVILLLLRSILSGAQEKLAAGEFKDTKLITEVLDSENQPLIARAGVRDFIISNRFISMLLAQISEDPNIKKVYDDLFAEEGSEIYVKPADLYFESFPVEVSYADLIHVAQQREEVCLGVKIHAHESDLDRNFGVQLIPDKNEILVLQAEDSLVVLAEDES
jgi:hypothetical protein